MARMLGRYRIGFCGNPRCCPPHGGVRKRKRAERRHADAEACEAIGAALAAMLDALDPAGFVQYDGDCRHGCNGDCVVLGAGSDVCDWQCHPGLTLDSVKAARFEEKVADLTSRASAAADLCI
jgi:hypothetical protein